MGNRLMHFMQLSNEAHMELAKALWNKVLRGERGHDEHVRKCIRIEWLPESIRRSIHPF